MGDYNQTLFVKDNRELIKAPFLEIGSKDYDGYTQDLRSLFSNDGEYIGIDSQEGDRVDHVLDFTASFDELDSTLNGKRFGTIFCLSVLEHCRDPFAMAKNITRFLDDNGTLVISVPFAWKFHGYPSDYWRFTHEGIKVLFPDIVFDEVRSCSKSPIDGESFKLDANIGRIDLSFSRQKKQGYTVRGLSAGLLKSLSGVGIFRWLTGYQYVMRPTNVMMIGTKRS